MRAEAIVLVATLILIIIMLITLLFFLLLRQAAEEKDGEATQVVTQLVTEEVTREVTREPLRTEPERTRTADRAADPTRAVTGASLRARSKSPKGGQQPRLGSLRQSSDCLYGKRVDRDSRECSRGRSLRV